MTHPRGLSPINPPDWWHYPTTLESAGADNLRALVMPEPVQLRRLMILAGGNGIGKSTYARLFPLLRQSMGTRTREPILWWDQDGVDFGTFADAVRRGEEEIRLRFGFHTELIGEFSATAILKGDASRCAVHAREVSTIFASLTIKTNEGSGPSHAILARPGGSPYAVASNACAVVQSHPSSIFVVDVEPQLELLRQLTDPLFHGNTSPERRLESLTNLPFDDAPSMLDYLRGQDFGAKYKSAIRSLSQSPARVERLLSARQIVMCLSVLSIAEGLLSEFTQDTAYLGPFRAAGERLYRAQSLAIETLDRRGVNLPMFLLALTEEELADLNKFLSDHLEFSVRVEPDGSQHRVEVRLRDAWYNLVDVGFGYSQLLPVAVQLWGAGKVLTFQRRKKPLRCVVIEQPELHLHPHHQGLLARALVASAAAAEGPVQIIETHSAALIEEIGMLIARGRVEADRVGIYCFEARPDGGAAVRNARFDEDGVLHDWPVGFLSA